MKKLFNTLFIFFIIVNAQAQTVVRYAGTAGMSGSTDGGALSGARFNSPHGICVDKSGNVFVADRYNNKIRKITLAGVVSTLAGSGAGGANDGTGAAATFHEPWAIACDTLGNLYVADTKSYKIRKIVSATGVVTTVAGTGTFGTTNGAVNVAQFGYPTGIAVSKDGSIIYVADQLTHVIRKIQGGMVGTIAGQYYVSGSTDGAGLTAAKFDHPYGICLDNSGNVIIADSWNFKIRKITIATNIVSTVAGTGVKGFQDGLYNVATFDSTWGVVVDSIGNIYVGDGANYTIRRITPGGIVSRYAGKTGMPGFTDGDTSIATFSGVTSLAYYKPLKCLFVGDSYNHLIRQISPLSTTIVTLTTNSANNTFCIGASVILTAAPAGLTNYTFKDGVNTIGTSTTVSYTTSTLSLGVHNITCTAIDAFGLPVTSDPITVTIVASTAASITPPGPISICTGDSVLLTASPGITYHWSTGALTQKIFAKTAGSYLVTVTTSGGCSGLAAPVSVTLKPIPSSVQTSNDTVCPMNPGQINAVPQAGVTCYWYEQLSGGSSLYAGSSFTTPPVSQTTPYYLELHGSNGCINPNRSAVYVIVDQKPSSSFQVSLPSIVSNGIQVYFYNSTSGGTQYEWNFGDPLSSENTSTLENPTHIYPQPGNYNITLVSTNQKGCTDSLFRLILVEHNLSIFIPTTFTPNMDGNNDIFRVRGTNIKSVSMNIFNQWGEKIYQSEENKWDGTVKGDPVQNGTYTYYIEVKYNNETSEKFKGQITVIR